MTSVVSDHHSGFVLSSRRPIALFVLLSVLLLIAVALTPQLLITLGPMRGSLTHEKELVRQTALTEIRIVRAASLAGAVILTLLLIKWEAFRKSRLVRAILSYDTQPLAPAGPRQIFNGSFWVMLALLVLWQLYLALGGSVLSAAAMERINREDGVIEGGTALAFLAASLVSLALLFRTQRRARRVVLGLFAFGFFVCAGEEISWGQRILGFETPEALAAVNVQEELNLHNMLGYFADHLFIAGVFVYGVVVPLLAGYALFWRNLFDKLGVPVPSLGLAVGFLLVSLNHDWLLESFYIEGRSTNRVRTAEGRELLSAIGFCLLLAEAWFRPAQADRAPHPRPSRT